jgi:hypothetical protein
MHDPVPVCESNRREDLAGVLDGDGNRSWTTRNDELLERAAVEILHGDVVGALCLATVVDRHDVGMREARGVLRLAAETLDELVVACVAVVEDLDRYASAEHLVLSEVDVRHSARAELAEDAIAPVKEGIEEGVGDCHAASSE